MVDLKKVKEVYKKKAKDSFKTKMNLFVYEMIVNDKSEFSIDDFKNYHIKKDVVDEYTKVYWQEETDFPIRNKTTIKEIWKRIDKLKKEKKITIKECEDYYIKEVFPAKFPEDKFQKLLQADECCYCGITICKLPIFRTTLN